MNKKSRAAAYDRIGKKLAKAKAEFEGFKWLLDRDINIENCIYYDHKAIFSFGWRTALAESVKSALTKELKAFPFDYELK